MCPNCSSIEIADLLRKTSNLESYLKLKKCHECDQVFIIFDFGYADETEIVVDMA